MATSLVAELAEKLSSATNNFDIDEGTMYVNTSADTVGIGTTNPASKLDVQGTMQVGVDDTGHDVKFFGATAGAYMLWDESADELVLGGDSKLSFHDAAGGENIIASADGHLEINAGTTLDITAATVDINSATKFNVDGPTQLTGAVTIGVDDTGYDVKFFGDTASAYMLWDASADDLILGGAAGLEVATKGTFGGASDGVEVSQGAIALKNGGSVSKIDFYCEQSNAHYTRLQSAPHASYSGNITLTLPASDGDAGQFLKTDGSGVMSWAAAGGAYNDWNVISSGSSHTATSKDQLVILSASAFTVTLPAGSVNDSVTIHNAGAGTVTVASNGSEKIGGEASDSILDVNGQALTLVYVDSTKGWVNVQETQTSVTGKPPYICASVSGTCNTLVTADTNFKVATFVGPGTFTVNSGGGSLAKIDYMVMHLDLVMMMLM